MAKIMKKIFTFVVAATMLAGCSQDLMEDAYLPGAGDTTDNVEWYDLGIKLVASIEDATRVTVSGDSAAATSTMAWESGDLLSVAYDGKVYEYACTNSGAVGEFAPTSDTEYIAALDSTKPLAVYYNVKSVAADTQVATFDIPAAQVVGELSNKLPLYSYTAAPALVDNRLPIKMSALASVVEFDLKAASAWNVDAASFAPTSRAQVLDAGFVAATDILVDPVTGATSLADTAVQERTITLSLGALTNVAEGLKMQFVVGPAKFQGKATAENKGVFTGACLKLFKEENENFRKTIWTTAETLVDLSQGHKHVYQAASNILDGHKDGIRTVEDLWAFRNEHQSSVETKPIGTGFCDEDGVVRLHADLKVEDWKYIGNTGSENNVNFRWYGLFDGQDHTVEYTMQYDWDNQTWTTVNEDGEVESFSTASAGFFNTLGGGYIKNLTVKGNIHVEFHQPESVNPAQDHWTYVGGLVGQIHGGVVENCKSYVTIDATDHWSGKLRCGGITGRLAASTGDVEVLDCENRGDIDLRLKNPTKPLQSIPGGLVGLMGDDANGYLPYMENCANYGNIYVGNNNFKGNHFLGGCIGVVTCAQKEHFDLVELYNYGEVKSECTPTVAQTLYIGGIAGRLQYASRIECVNGEEGTDKGKISDTAYTWTSGTKIVSYIGGVVGNIDAGTTAAVDSCVNYAPVSTYAPTNTCIGGVVGLQTAISEVLTCENYGRVTIDVPAASYQAVFGGGILGKIGASEANTPGKLTSFCDNYGDVIISAPSKFGNYFGGVVGALYGGTGATDKSVAGATVNECTNSGNVIVVEGGGSALYNRVGGIAGLCNSSSIKNSSNYGNVDIYSARGQNNSYGGVLGYDNQSDFTHEFTNNVNEGNVTVYCEPVADETNYTKDWWHVVGGVIGQINSKKGSVTVSGNKNIGIVASNKGSYAKPCYIASICGYVQNTAGMTSFADNKVGGSIGSATTDGYVPYDPEKPDTYKPGTVTATTLDNTADSDYYWEKWIYGGLSITISGHTFAN